MNSFDEAVQSFGWTTDADGNHLAVVGGVEVYLERLLFGQWYLKVCINGAVVAEPVPVYPGGTEQNRAVWEDAVSRSPEPMTDERAFGVFDTAMLDYLMSAAFQKDRKITDEVKQEALRAGIRAVRVAMGR